MRNINFKQMLVMLFALLAGSCSDLPSDKSMEDQFRANEADFNKLITMFKEDKLVDLIPEAGYTLPEKSNDSEDRAVKVELAPQRMDEYRRLLRLVNAKRVVGNSRIISLFVWEKNSDWDWRGIPDETKEYFYSELTPDQISPYQRSPLVDSLDKPESLPISAGYHRGFKKIGNNWYLEYSKKIK